MSPRKLVLHNSQAPGDIVMLSAAIRALHETHKGAFTTDVRTPYPDLWRHNPFITPISDDEEDTTHLLCEYPLIELSNHAPYHFIHGFAKFIADSLKLDIFLDRFKGDIHLSEDEKRLPSPLEKITGSDIPYWVVNAGGKSDFTVKWWNCKRYQEVIDHFCDRICFVQVGSITDHHPALSGVVDLRGKTTLRELIHVVRHAAGVLCPVTMVMHLAAAVEARVDRPPNRPCVVVAGGRESPHWEAYPFHQFIHNVGSLACCSKGGCWKSRTVPLYDDDPNDFPERRCLTPILYKSGKRIEPGSPDYDDPSPEAVARNDYLPRCMDLITSTDVIRAIERYFEGGVTHYLSKDIVGLIQPHLTRPTDPATST